MRRIRQVLSERRDNFFESDELLDADASCHLRASLVNGLKLLHVLGLLLSERDVVAAVLRVIASFLHGSLEFLLINEADLVENTEDGDSTANEQHDNLPERVRRELVHYDTASEQVAEDNAALVGRHGI